MGKVNFITYDPDNHDFEGFETIDQAEKNINLLFDEFDPDEGYSEEVGSGGYLIAKVIKKSNYKAVHEKKDYTDEEWEEMGYSQDFDRVEIIEIASCIDPVEEIKSLMSLIDIETWWNSLNEMQKQNLANLVFNPNKDWVALDSFEIGDLEKKLMYCYSKII